MSDIFDFDPKPDQYAVMGNPIAHSKSPQIHQYFASQTRQKMEYHAIHVDLGGFEQAVRNFQAHLGKGLNITVPFKVEAFQLADKLSQRAQMAGAVNTLVLENKEIFGDNTDGYGLVSDLKENLQWSLAASRILVLGAGGAARGVLQPLLEEQPERIYIANRTPAKARELAEHFATLGQIHGGGYENVPDTGFDIIINATAASLNQQLPPLEPRMLHDQTCCYDMMYAAKPTAFMQWAQTHGARETADGLGMLVGQAAESFYLWRHVRPQVQPVIQQIRKQLEMETASR